MSKRLEQFVQDNREDFDKFEPGPVVWHNIQQQLKKPAEKKGILITMKAIRWSAAAAVIIMLGVGGYFYMKSKDVVVQPIAETGKKQPNADTPLVKKDNALPVHDSLQDINNNPTNSEQLAQNNDADESNEELIHYTRLIEIKQNQIRKIKKDEPLLYQQFAGDINKLDSNFHLLKKQLPVNPNREQILEAMIQNLQLQEAVLNQQLNIIKKINQTKKVEYEKAYKSI